MSAEENRRIALQWIGYLTESRYDELFALGAPDATWWLSGLKETSPFAGTYPYAEREKHMREVFKEKKSSKFTMRDITTEGDTVIIEGSPKVEVPDGRVYENDVVLKFVFKEGKIQSLREYLDFLAILKFMGAQEGSE